MGHIVGQIVELARFPVKSMAGERMAEAEIDWQGMEGDRQYAFRLDYNRTRFPWFTARDLSELALYQASFRDPQAPKTSPVDVATPDGDTHLIGDDALRHDLTQRIGAPISLIQLARGCYDSMPVSLVTTASHRAVEDAHGAALDRRRFRSNLVIESAGSEREWLGRRIAIGDTVELCVAEPIARCAMITVDPDTAVRDPSVLRTVAQQFGNRYGIYASPARVGVIRVGDAVRLLD